jgi:Domain of unknown function (DUF4249)
MKFIKYFSIVLGFIAIASCGNPEDIFSPIIDVKLPPFKSKLVVTANFEANTDSLVLYLSRSRSALDTADRRVLIRVDTFGFSNGKPILFPYYTEYDTLINAKVELFRNDVLVGAFKYSGLSTYTLRQKLVADGAIYRIRAELAGYDVVEATQRMPIPAKLDSVRFVKDGAVIQSGIDTRKSNEYSYFFTDPVDLGNFYYVQAIQYDTSFSYDLRFSPESLDKSAQSGFLSDKTFNGKPYIWRNQYEYAVEPIKGSRVEYKLLASTTDLFQFIRSKALNDTAKDNPFAEPVILYTNVKNGFGIFTLTASSIWIKKY